VADVANATGLRPQGASGSRENIFSPSVVKSFDITSATKKYKWAVLIAGYKKIASMSYRLDWLAVISLCLA